MTIGRCWVLLAILVASAETEGQRFVLTRDTPMPDVTKTQTDALVITPAVFIELGSQDRAISDMGRRIDQLGSTLDGMKSDIRELQQCEVQVNLIKKIVVWLVSLVIGSGMVGWFANFLRDRKKPRDIHAGSLGL